jgi:hypothetical protein
MIEATKNWFEGNATLLYGHFTPFDGFYRFFEAQNRRFFAP